jgi:hypothetical protein
MGELSAGGGSPDSLVALQPGTFDGIDPLPLLPVLPHVEAIGTLPAASAILYGAATILRHMTYETGGKAPQEVIDRVVETARENGVPEGHSVLMAAAARIEYFWEEFGNNV